MAMIEVRNLKIHYPIRSGFFNRVTDHVLAVDGIDFDIEQGETYGLIGESGSGKSTAGKAIVGLEPGHVRLDYVSRAGYYQTQRSETYAVQQRRSNDFSGLFI